MAIPVNQLNDNALAALASMRASNLNLPLFAYDPTKFSDPILKAQALKFQAQQDINKLNVLGENQANIQNIAQQGALDRQKLSNEGQMAYGQQQNLFAGQQGDLNRAVQQQQLDQSGKYQQQLAAIQQQQVNNTGQYQQGMLGLTQQRNNIDQATQQSNAMLNQVKAAMLLKQQELNMVGGTMAAGMQGMMYADTPEEQQQIMENTAQHLVESGIVPNYEAATKMIGKTPQQFVTNAQYYSNIARLAGDAKEKGMSVGPGGNFSFTPKAGGTVQANVMPTEDEAKDITKKLSALSQQTEVATDLLQTYDPKWDKGLNRLLVPTVGEIQPLLGYDGPGTYNEMKDQKEAWMSKATRLNVDLADISGLKLSTRTQQVLKGMLIKDSDDIGSKQAKLKAIIELNRFKQQQLADQLRSGTAITPQENEQINKLIENTGVQLGIIK